jgi:Peptidase A4 family
VARPAALAAGLIVVVWLLCAGSAAAGVARGSVVHGVDDAPAASAVSSNWAGFVVAGLGAGAVGRTPTFTRVAGTWTQPAATCTGGSAAYSAFWVGIGGASETSQALEQIGSAADCAADGAASYYLWYELVPAAPRLLKLRVEPADVITASVAVSAKKKVTLSIRDLTRRTKFSKVLKTSAPDRSSAEWVAEAPSECFGNGACRTLPLTNFGTLAFTNASATANGHKGPISDPAWGTTAVNLQAGSAGRSAPSGSATPGELSIDGKSFTVSWLAPAPAPAPSPTPP